MIGHIEIQVSKIKTEADESFYVPNNQTGPNKEDETKA
jgi:hypothetical protein